MTGSPQTKANAAKLYQRLHQIAQDKGTRGGADQPKSQTRSNAGAAPINTQDTRFATEPQSPPQQQPDRTTPLASLSPITIPQESAVLPGTYKPLPEELLLEWTAPSRPFRKPNRRFFTTITMIAILIGLILFFANQMLPVAVVIAVIFLTYVLFSIPPSDVNFRLTTYGVRIEGQLYYWEELGRFWFTQQYNIDVLHIEVARFPNTVHLLLGDLDRETMKQILSEVLLHERPALTAVERAGKWLQEKVPLDLET